MRHVIHTVGPVWEGGAARTAVEHVRLVAFDQPAYDVLQAALSS